MSALLTNNRLTTSFAYNKVAAVPDFDVESLVRDHSAGAPSQASSNASTTDRQTRRNIDRGEPCFITKCPSYTLERAHWINPVRKNPSLKLHVENILKELAVVRASFDLNDTTNLTNLDRMLHASLDKYGFFAVTASLTTLEETIKVVVAENRIWQEKFDRDALYYRDFGLDKPPFTNAQYELVVLHPDHFLPQGSSLTVYTPVNNQLLPKDYVVGQDRTLRQLPGTLECPRLPPFAFDANRQGLPVNTLLVVLNAEIKFRRYKRMLSTQPMPDFPEDVQRLIDTTIELVDLIYWKPERKNVPYRRRADLSFIPIDDIEHDAPDVETGFRPGGEDLGDDEDTPRKSRRNIQVLKSPGENGTLEQRKEYTQYLLSGHDFELDSDDEDLLEELGYGPEFSDDSTLDPMHVAEKIHEWQQGV